MKRILSFLPALLLAGCATYMPTSVSTNSVGSEFEKPVRVTSGRSSAFYFFGETIGPIGNDSIQAAVEDAVSNDRADSISNVFVDRKFICVPFPCQWGYSLIKRIDTVVYGTLVKYDFARGGVSK